MLIVGRQTIKRCAISVDDVNMGAYYALHSLLKLANGLVKQNPKIKIVVEILVRKF